MIHAEDSAGPLDPMVCAGYYALIVLILQSLPAGAHMTGHGEGRSHTSLRERGRERRGPFFTLVLHFLFPGSRMALV